jgi:hypothetical protein
MFVGQRAVADRRYDPIDNENNSFDAITGGHSNDMRIAYEVLQDLGLSNREIVAYFDRFCRLRMRAEVDEGVQRSNARGRVRRGARRKR